MPGMTRVLVTDPKMLDGLKDGEKVTFTADKVSGALTVTSIEAAK
jgi:Cu(I)/Ag(I) efflux system protein CusF